MNLRKQTLIGVAWSAVRSWGTRFISFFVFMILARLLDPADLGLIAYAGVYIAILSIFGDQSFGAAIEQRETIEPGHLDSIFWLFLALGLIMTGFTVAFAPFVAALFREPELSPVLRWLSISYLFIVLSGIQTSILKRNLKMKVLAYRSLAGQLMGGIVGVSMALRGHGVWSLVGMQLTSSGVGTAILWIQSDWRPGFVISRRYLKDLGSFGIAMMGARALDFFNRRSDDLLIGYYLGPAALGLYNVAYRMLLVLTELLTGTTTQVALPAFSKIQSDPAKLCRIFYQAVRTTSIISLPAFVGLAITAPQIIPLAFGEQWLSSIPVMRLLAFIGLLHSVSYYNGSVMIAMGKPAPRLILLTIHTVVNVLAFFYVVRWGIVAVASAYVIRGYLLTPMDLAYIKRLIPFSFRSYAKALLPAVSAGAVMSIAIIGAQTLLPDSVGLVGELAVSVGVGAASYTGGLFVLSRSAVTEILELINLLKSKETTG